MIKEKSVSKICEQINKFMQRMHIFIKKSFF